MYEAVYGFCHEDEKFMAVLAGELPNGEPKPYWILVGDALEADEAATLSLISNLEGVTA